MRTELDKIFGTKTPVVRKTAKPRTSPAAVIKELDRNLAILRKSFGDTLAATPIRKGADVILKQTERRDFAFQAATGDESLGTLSARAGGDNG